MVNPTTPVRRRRWTPITLPVRRHRERIAPSTAHTPRFRLNRHNHTPFHYVPSF